MSFLGSRQKAPSAKRCIKTLSVDVLAHGVSPGQKAPSAKRCIKTAQSWGEEALCVMSESTERQKVH